MVQSPTAQAEAPIGHPGAVRPLLDEVRALAHKWRHEAVRHENAAHEIYCDEDYQETEESQLHRETAAALRQCSRELLEILDPEPKF